MVVATTQASCLCLHSLPERRQHTQYLSCTRCDSSSSQNIPAPSPRMPERRPTSSLQSASSRTAQPPTNNVRRNLFHQHLSRRPTTSSTSTSAETVRFDAHNDESEDTNSEIVIRNGNGEFEIAGGSTAGSGDGGIGFDVDDDEIGGGEAEEESKLLV